MLEHITSSRCPCCGAQRATDQINYVDSVEIRTYVCGSMLVHDSDGEFETVPCPHSPAARKRATAQLKRGLLKQVQQARGRIDSFTRNQLQDSISDLCS